MSSPARGCAFKLAAQAGQLSGASPFPKAASWLTFRSAQVHSHCQGATRRLPTDFSNTTASDVRLGGNPTTEPPRAQLVENRDRAYAVDLRPDGSFRIEDVPAGRYVLKLPFEGLSRGTREGQQAIALRGGRAGNDRRTQ